MNTKETLEDSLEQCVGIQQLIQLTMEESCKDNILYSSYIKQYLRNLKHQKRISSNCSNTELKDVLIISRENNCRYMQELIQHISVMTSIINQISSLLETIPSSSSSTLSAQSSLQFTQSESNNHNQNNNDKNINNYNNINNNNINNEKNNDKNNNNDIDKNSKKNQRDLIIEIEDKNHFDHPLVQQQQFYISLEIERGFSHNLNLIDDETISNQSFFNSLDQSDILQQITPNKPKEDQQAEFEQQTQSKSKKCLNMIEAQKEQIANKRNNIWSRSKDKHEQQKEINYWNQLVQNELIIADNSEIIQQEQKREIEQIDILTSSVVVINQFTIEQNNQKEGFLKQCRNEERKENNNVDQAICLDDSSNEEIKEPTNKHITNPLNNDNSTPNWWNQVSLLNESINNSIQIQMKSVPTVAPLTENVNHNFKDVNQGTECKETSEQIENMKEERQVWRLPKRKDEKWENILLKEEKKGENEKKKQISKLKKTKNSKLHSKCKNSIAQNSTERVNDPLLCIQLLFQKQKQKGREQKNAIVIL